MKETFSKPEIIKVTCDVHSWMLGWIAVLSHPYFGVTDEGGTTRPGETARVGLAFTKAG
jgi:hypothetical protein